MKYQAKTGDSPSRIARAYGLSRDALLRANPHKPTTVVAGQRTWRSLVPRETIIVPVGGMVGDSFVGVGDPAADVVNLLMAAGGPCLQANAGYVCQIQSILGITVDGKWGSGTAAAIRALVPNAPGGCSPTPAWWAPKGSSKCPGTSPTPSAPTPAGSSLDRAASAAVAALLGDPNYCASVKRAGTPVNTAVHNFKAAWNANSTNPVPIGTGNYEPSVQVALALALNTSPSNVPPGCGTAAAVPPSPTPPPFNASTTVPAPTPSSFVNPCDPSNVAAVCAMQRAAGLTVDGKYGANTASAARRLDPSAPGPCSPRPGWWKPAGQSNCAGAAQPMPPPGPPPAPPPPTPIVTPVTVPAPVAALTTIDPCAQSSLDVVYAAQRALGVSPDGKYGNDTATAARRLLPTAPAGCSPRPGWWAPKGASNLPGGQTVPTPPPRPPQPGKTVVVPIEACPPGTYPNPSGQGCLPMPATPPGPGGQPIVVAPEPEKKLSTGAIVAGAIGAAALVGLIAVAATSKKGHRGARGPRGPGKRKHSHRKSTHRKKK
jgi:hypothetical protein